MDLFGEKFQFRFGKSENTRKTTLGQTLSLIVVGTSLAYLAFLIWTYINNGFQPSVIEQQNSVTKVTQTLDYSPLMFKFNLPPSITTDTQRARYFKFYAQIAVGNEDGQNITIVDCKDVAKNSKFVGYYCLDLSEIPDLYHDSDGNQNKIFIRVWQCTGPPGNPDCESNVNIQTQMKNRMFSISTLIAYFEYNTETGQVEIKTKQKNIPGDDAIVAQYIVSLKQTVLEIDHDLIRDNYVRHDFISSFDQDLIPVKQQFMQSKYGLKAPVFMQFELKMELSQVSIKVQYIKLPQILAMYSAIFGVLLNVGIIASLSSKSLIYKDMIDNYLKQYYKETAFQLMSEQHLRKSKSSSKNNTVSDEYIKEIEKKMLQDDVMENEGWINTIQLYLKSKQENKKSAKVEAGDQQQLSDLNKEQIFNLINKKLPGQMNARNLYNELYMLKTAVHLLLSPEQYSSLMHLGRRLIKNQEIQDINQINLNHIEKQTLLDENVFLRSQLAQKYLDDHQNDLKLPEFDQRIMDSHLSHYKINQNQQFDQKNKIKNDIHSSNLDLSANLVQ